MLHSNQYHQVPMEQDLRNWISYNGDPTNPNKLNAEVKALHQQLVQAQEQRAIQE